jgi:fluoroquinolone transport system permease protein
MKKWLALLRRDARGLYRDRLLVFLAGYALGLAVITRVTVRWVPILYIELYVAPMVIVFAAGLIGLVGGFTMIDERETGTWLLLRVLPVSRRMITFYWIVTVTTFCAVVTLASAALYGMSPQDLLSFVLLLVAASLSAPLIMLCLGALASNKIEGIAIGKIISGSALLLISLFVLPAKWQLLLVWYPWYWVYLGLLRAYAGAELASSLAVPWLDIPMWMYITIPLVLQIGAIVVLARRSVTA